MPDRTTATDWPLVGGLLFLCVYPAVIMLHGIDFSDMGFNLANQWLLIHHPDSYQFGYLFYLSNLLGGLWLWATEPFGLLGARLGWVLLVIAIIGAAIGALRDLVPTRPLVAGLGLSLIWSTRVEVVWIDYNHVAALFGVLAALCLCRRPDRLGSGLAGLLVACAALARLPSLSLLLLGVALLVPVTRDERSTERAWRAGIFLGATAVGVALLLGLMSALGHLSPYLAAIRDQLVSPSDPGYTADALLTATLEDYTRVGLMLGIALVGGTLFVAFWTGRMAARAALPIMLGTLLGYLSLGHDTVGTSALLAAGLTALCFAVADRSASTMRNGAWLCDLAAIALTSALLASALPAYWPWLIPALFLGALGAVAFTTDTLPLRRVLLVALALMIATPLGSSNGIRNTLFGLWLVVPLLVWLGCTIGRSAGVVSPTTSRAARALTCALCSALLFVGLSTVWHTPYRDASDRRTLTHAIDAPFVSSGRTTAARATVVGELSRALGNYVRPGSELLVHGSCPLLHVITRTRPALRNSWPALYAPDIFEHQLEHLTRRGPHRPPIVMSAGSCRNATWPQHAQFNTREQAQRQQLLTFMAEQRYESAWSNSFFSIWTVAGSRPAVRARKLGGTARLARDEGEQIDAVSLTVGLRMTF